MLFMVLVCTLLVIGVLIGSVNVPWPYVLFTHFRIQYLVLLVVCAMCASKVGYRRLAIVSTLCVLFALPNVVSFYLCRCVNMNREYVCISVASINLHSRGNSYSSTCEFILKEAPDILCLMEMSKNWQRELKCVLGRYKNHVISKEGNSAIFSNYQLYDMQRKEPCRYSRMTRIKVGDTIVSLVLVHLSSGKKRSTHCVRRKQLVDLVEVRKLVSDTIIMVGDFNMTSWCDEYRFLLKTWRLNDSRKGYGIQPTWPTWCPLLWVPIDHCFISDDIAILDRRVGPDVGSDHYPVCVELGIPGNRDFGD